MRGDVGIVDYISEVQRLTREYQADRDGLHYSARMSILKHKFPDELVEMAQKDGLDITDHLSSAKAHALYFLGCNNYRSNNVYDVRRLTKSVENNSVTNHEAFFTLELLASRYALRVNNSLETTLVRGRRKPTSSWVFG